jgi:hypothetical protein
MSKYLRMNPCTLPLRTSTRTVHFPFYHERQVQEPRPQSTSRTVPSALGP